MSILDGTWICDGCGVRYKNLPDGTTVRANETGEHRCTEEHERSVEAAARRELSGEIRQLLTWVSARLSGTTAIDDEERERMAIAVEEAMRRGEE